MDEDRFARLLHRLEASSVACPVDLVGCTPREIEALEGRYGVWLPKTYRRYLEVMGHRSARLFTCDHAAVFYSYVLKMTAEKRQQWAEAKTEDGSGPPSHFELPVDALLINGRLGDQFEFIRCGSEDDPPVWYFNIWEWQVRQSASSVLEWLEGWCSEAERAIASGYFDLYPEGTTP